MKPNEKPSIFPKQARELRILKEEEPSPVSEDKLPDEEKPNVILMSKSSPCTIHDVRYSLRC